MLNIFKRLSLVPSGLRYKLMIVFCLMSIIPLLVAGYIVSNFVFPYTTAIGSLSIVLLITIFIAILGFVLARRMVEPIIDMALQAKLIAGGDFERSIEVTHEDEIGDLGNSLNIMTQRINENIRELKSYSEKTREINMDINKKVMVLSGLLQVGNLISAGTDLKTIMDVLVEKISLMDGANPALIMTLDRDKDNLVPISDINFKDAEAATMPASLQHGIFARLKAQPKEIIIDSRLTEETSEIGTFKQLYNLKNCVIIPIVLYGRLEGVILLGNSQENFRYKDDDIELLRVFSKQAAIAIENDFLFKKTEELEVMDKLTGLYNSKYIRGRLDEEIKRAILYQRPCSFILFSVDNFKGFYDRYGRIAGETALKKIAGLIASELTPVDKAARFSDSEFALVLPERNKKEARQIADDVRKKIAELTVHPEAEENDKRLTVTGSLSENPIDGSATKELIDKAVELLKEAQAASDKNIIRV